MVDVQELRENLAEVHYSDICDRAKELIEFALKNLIAQATGEAVSTGSVCITEKEFKQYTEEVQHSSIALKSRKRIANVAFEYLRSIKESGRKTEQTLMYEADGVEHRVQLDVGTYENHNLYVGISLVDSNGLFVESFDDVTVNLGNTLPGYCAYLNARLENVEKFLVDNDIAVRTGITEQQGFVRYQLYKFYADRLRELCPAGLDAYEAKI